MVTLYVLSEYRSRRIEYAAGTAIVVSEEEAGRLMADSPASFTLARPIEPDPEPEVLIAAPEAPPVDKAIRRRR